MPAVQSKAYGDVKIRPDDETVRTRGQLKTKNKDRSTLRKTDTILERLNATKRRKDIMPEMDPKINRIKKSNQLTKVNSGFGPKSPSSSRTLAPKPVKRQYFDVDKTYIKSNLKVLRNKLMDPSETYMDEVLSSRSLCYFSPRQEPYNSLVDVENINPNQLQDNYCECNELDKFFRNQFPDFEKSSEYEYTLATAFEEMEALPKVESESCNNRSPGVLKHFKELLHQEESSRTNLLGQDEIALLKNIVKADERHQKLRRDDYNLLKEILTGQLKEITQQERVIKIALKKIRSRTDDDVEVTTIRGDTAEQPMEDIARPKKVRKPVSARIHSSRGCALKCDTPKQEVDIIFKNVPSLEKEIRILRSLGLKLEETLKKSTSLGRKPFFEGTQHYPTVFTTRRIYFKHNKCLASSRVTAKACCVVTDVAQEYQIRHQTIDELKLEREFFIPSDIVDRFTLQPTNFHKLSRNPELLLRRLKPCTKDETLKFNFIEQNPMFFNHFLAKMCNICLDSIEGHDTYIPKSEKLLFVKSGAGDHPDYIPSELEVPVVKKKASSLTSLSRKKKKNTSPTPLLEQSQVTPKNNLLRTIIVGTIQLSIILTVITAILYPDLICH